MDLGRGVLDDGQLGRWLQDVVRAGLRTNALNSVLFPEDPIANASQIISDLSGIFPPFGALS